MRKALKVAGALLALLVVAMITGFQPLYWLIYVVLAGAVVGYMWVWAQSRGLETSVVELSPYPQVGQTVHLRVSVREKLGLPRAGLRARLVGDFTTIGEEDFALMPKVATTWTASGLCQHRGLNSIGALAMVANDPSGLLSLECRVGQSQNILVYPSTVELSRTIVQGQASGGELGVSGTSPGHSPAVSQVREYAPGDSLTRIHWPTTAKLDKLMTKEFEAAGINEIMIFVDLHEAVHAGTGTDSTEECCITIAASLAKGLIHYGHAVGLLTQGDRLYHFSADKNTNHLWSVLGALAMVRATGRVSLQALITQEGANLGPGTVAMVVAPWPGRSIDALFRFLTRRGVLVVPVYLDTPTFGRPVGARWSAEPRVEIREWGVAVKRGDDLSVLLGKVLDQIASY